MMRFDFNSSKLVVNDARMVDFVSDIYEESRYLKGASEEDLEQRLIGFVANLIQFQSNGDPHFVADRNAAAIAFVELRREYELRSTPIDDLLAGHLMKFSGMFNQADIDRIQRVLEQFRGRKCLFKFVQSCDSDSLIAGAVRFQTAASYNDKTLTATICDDELAIEHRLSRLKLLSKTGQEIPVRGDKMTVSAAGNYYVSCFSSSFKLQYFSLFGRDCCVVISDAEQFARDVTAAYKAKFRDDEIVFGPVEYIDRFRRLKGKAPIELWKSSDYEFQDEYRFASWDLDSNNYLDPVRIVQICPDQYEFMRIYEH